VDTGPWIAASHVPESSPNGHTSDMSSILKVSSVRFAMATFRLVDSNGAQIGPVIEGNEPSATFPTATKILETFPAGRLELEELDEATGEWLATGRTFGRFV